MAAPFTLATGKPRSGTSSGGLKAGKLNAGGGARLNAVQVDTRAGNIGFSAANVPQAVQDQTSAGMQAFMGATAEAAFRFQDRESTYFANESVLNTQQKLDGLIRGSTNESGEFKPGYLSLARGEASKAFPTLKESINKLIQQDLMNLEPRVREKAAIQSQQAGNSAMAIASKHRLVELGKAEEALQYQQLKHMSGAVALDYRKLRVPDANGKTIKNRVYEVFASDPEEADKAYYGLVTESLQMIVNQADNFDDGIKVAEDIFNKEFASELAGDLGALNATSSFFRTARMQNERFKWNKEDRAIKVKERADEIRWDAEEMLIRESTLETGIPMSEVDLLQKFIDDEISEGYYKSYKAQYYGGTFKLDSDYVDSIYARLGRGEPVDMTTEVNQSLKLDETTKREMRKFASNMTNPAYGDRMKNHLLTAINALNRGNEIAIFDKSRQSDLTEQARRDIARMITQGRSDTDITQYLEDYYSYSKRARGYLRNLAIPREASADPGTPLVPVDTRSVAAIDQAVKDVQDNPNMSPEDKSDFYAVARDYREIAALEEDNAVKVEKEQEVPPQEAPAINTLTAGTPDLTAEDVAGITEDTKDLDPEQSAMVAKQYKLERVRKTNIVNEELQAQDADRKALGERLLGNATAMETAAIEASGLTDPNAIDRFLGKSRRDRLNNLEKAGASARGYLRRLKATGASEEDIGAAETDVWKLEDALNLENQRQYGLNKQELQRKFGGNE